jgi:hypothetical protein
MVAGAASKYISLLRMGLIQIEMVSRSLLLVSSLEIVDLIMATGQQQCFHLVSACFPKMVESGNKAATKQPQSGNGVSTLFPLLGDSKISFEVLRLGLVWVQSQNFHHCNGGYFE